VAPTRSEEGCIIYDLNRDVEDPLEIMLYENRRSKADLDEHLSGPHVNALLAKLPELLEDGVGITLFELEQYAADYEFRRHEKFPYCQTTCRAFVIRLLV
jgi:quinol monooxygenase YgiN